MLKIAWCWRQCQFQIRLHRTITQQFISLYIYSLSVRCVQSHLVRPPAVNDNLNYVAFCLACLCRRKHLMRPGEAAGRILICGTFTTPRNSIWSRQLTTNEGYSKSRVRDPIHSCYDITIMDLSPRQRRVKLYTLVIQQHLSCVLWTVNYGFLLVFRKILI